MESRPCFDACDMVAPSKSAVTFYGIEKNYNCTVKVVGATVIYSHTLKNLKKFFLTNSDITG